MKFDSLETEQKWLEKFPLSNRLMFKLPILARLDGRGFHKFTEGLQRPFCQELGDLMDLTLKHLVTTSNSLVGFCQSDELSLLFYSDNTDTQVYFDGKTQKMISILAAEATLFFNENLPAYLPEKVGQRPLFDCRVWQVPTKEDAARYFLWRNLDCTKNAVSMAAHSHFDHADLQGLHTAQLQEKLFQDKGINFNQYPSRFKRGQFVQRKKVMKKFSSEDVRELPANHRARFDPNLTVERSVVQCVDVPPFTKVLNKVKFLFDGEEPHSVE